MKFTLRVGQTYKTRGSKPTKAESIVVMDDMTVIRCGNGYHYINPKGEKHEAFYIWEENLPHAQDIVGPLIDYVPVVSAWQAEGEPWASTPFGELFFRTNLMVLYWTPTASCWNKYYTVDDFGNAVKVNPQGASHYIRQRHD